MYQLNKKALSE